MVLNCFPGSHNTASNVRANGIQLFIRAQPLGDTTLEPAASFEATVYAREDEIPHLPDHSRFTLFFDGRGKKSVTVAALDDSFYLFSGNITK